jgi:hypothetical protein
MRILPLRFLAVFAIISGGGAAFAETYTAQIYSVPAGYTTMIVNGAGDNGLMSGLVETGTGTFFAGYRTETGFKLMHPTGWYSSGIQDSWGSTYHCGSGKPTQATQGHALFWLGGGAAVDMHPPGSQYQRSDAWGGGGQLQAGSVQGDIVCPECGLLSVQRHACSWSKTAASFKRLHSQTHIQTDAFATDGTRTVGFGFHKTDGSMNALLWNTTSSFSINLRPSMSTQSQASSVWGNQQGGYYVGPATGGLYPHAVIWSGTAASAVDLNPAPFAKSSVGVVRNGVQAGSAFPTSNPTKSQAIAWHGTAGSWINLHMKLPYPFTLWQSTATGIDNLGNIVGYVSNDAGTDRRPVIWIKS